MTKYSLSNRSLRVKNRTVRRGGSLWPFGKKAKALPVQGPKTEEEANKIKKKNLEYKLKNLIDDYDEDDEEIEEINKNIQTHKKNLLKHKKQLASVLNALKDYTKPDSSLKKDYEESGDSDMFEIELNDHTTQSEELLIEIEIQELHIKLNGVKIKYYEKIKSIKQKEIEQIKNEIAKL